MNRLRKFSVLAILALSILLLPTLGQAQTISGIGARDCGAFTFAIEKDSNAALDSYVAWAQGYISANNVNGKGADIRLDSSSIIVWLSQFCAGNPRARVFDGIDTLIHQGAH